MQFISRYIIICLMGLALPCIASAADLMTVFHDAVKNDPKLKTAMAQRDETAQQMPAAFANLLPQISAQGSVTYNRNDIQGEIVNNVPPFQHSLDRVSGKRGMGFSISLKQSIFNFKDWLAVASARNEVKAAFATYTAAIQDLIQRTANAYFDVLKAEDNVRYTQAEKKALKQQYKQAQANFKVGTSTITDVYNAQASYDSAKAQYVSAKNNLSDKREALRAITDHRYDHLKQAHKLPLVKPHPNNIDQWVKMAHHHNWKLKAAYYQMLAAHDNIDSAEGNHLPTVNLQGSFSNNHENNIYDQGSNRQKTINASVNVDVPIFSGGADTTKVHKAIAQYNEKASQYSKTNRDVVQSTRSAYLGVMSGISQIKAERQAIKSHKSSLRGMKEGYKVGTRTIVDVLDAQQKLYNIQKQASKARYDYLSNMIDLKQAAGTLNLADLKHINDMLNHKPSQQANNKQNSTQS